MAAQTIFSLAEEELSCPICFEDYNFSEKNKQPKLLLCLHTFCLGCVQSLQKNDGILECPICRTSLQSYKTCDLMDNHIIFDFLRTRQETEDKKLAEHVLAQEYLELFRDSKEKEEREPRLAPHDNETHKEETKRLRENEKKKKTDNNSKDKSKSG